MPYKIVIGRDEADRKKLGDKGLIYLGKHYVKMGETTSLSNKVFMDVARAHVVMISGKRGSGKSFSLGVMAEEMAGLPKEVSKNLSVLILDTMGIFWTMKFPNERQEDLLAEWDLKPAALDVDIYTPIGYHEKYKKEEIPTDYAFAIKPSELNAGDWCSVFDIKLTDPIGILIERVIEGLKEKRKNYSIGDIIEFIQKDKRSEKSVRDAAENRFVAADRWGLFSEKGTEIKDLIKRGKVSILDLSCYTTVSGAWSIKALVIGLIARKLLVERIVARKVEELKTIKTGTKYFVYDEKTEKKKEMPLVWIMIDECLPYDSEIITNKGHTPIGKIVERYEKGENFKVLGYDYLKGKYRYYNVTNVFKKPKRKTLKVITETGKELRCTEDHKILTKNGFLPAKEAKEIATPVVQYYSNDKKCIIARLIGHIFGDGWLSSNEHEIGFSGEGNLRDLEKIKEDLLSLGFSSGKIRSRTTNSEVTPITGKKLKISGISQEMRASTKVFRYFLKLGAPIGNKAKCKFLIPKWLLKASDEEKVEFLSALMGSDGQIISQTKRIGCDFNPIRLSFSKVIHLEKNAWKYANQIKRLFEDLGVKVSKIRKRDGNIRKDGTKTMRIVLTLAKNVENIVKFLEKIDYRYCERKEIEANKWLAYFKSRLRVKREREELRKKAILLHKDGLGKIRIGRKLSIPEYQAREWIYCNRKAWVPKSFPSFENWINERYDNKVIYEKIIDKKQFSKENLYDISVDNVHNFVANGCIVHNCHEFLPRVGTTPATDALTMLIKEGRQPGISLVLATQQPGGVHKDVLTQSDIVISHRITSRLDIEALNSMMQTYLITDLQGALNQLPRLKGSAVILDDNSERMYPMRVRPRFTWHGGEAPTAVQIRKRLELEL